MKHYYIKVLEIIGVLALTVALLIASNTPGNGAYEVSIYQAYSPLFWVLLAIAIILGLSSIFGELFLGQRPYGWVPGLLLVATVNTLILALPYLRDYAFITQWDPVGHFSRAANVLHYKHPDPQNFYPISHLLATEFSLITALDLEVVILLFPVFFYLVYLTNTVFLAWTLDTDLGVRGLMMVLATPLVFGTYSTIFRPTHFTVYMFPFFIGWLYKTRWDNTQVVDTIAFVLLLLFLPFLHPWAVVSSVVLLFLFISTFLFTNKHTRFRSLHLSNPVLILCVVWLTWFLTFRVFGHTVRDLIKSFSEGITEGHSFEGFVAVAERAELPLTKIFELIAYTYGPALLYFIPAGVVISWSLVQLIQRNRQIRPQVSALSFFVVGFGFLAIMSLFIDLVTQNPLRLLNIAAVCVPILLAEWFSDFVSANPVAQVRIKILKGCIYLVIISSSLLGVLSSYTSPLIGQSNHQFTYAQKKGVEFLVDKFENDNKSIYSPFAGTRTTSSIFNFEDLQQLRRDSPTWKIELAPADFGYGPDYLNIEFENPGYLWVTAHERAYYTEVWPEGGRFTAEAFDKLNTKPHWHQIYTSGDFTIWRKSHFEFEERRASHE